MSLRTEPVLAPSIEEVAPPAWALALALLIALVAQTTIVPLLAFRGAFPSIVLTLVLWYALHSGMRAGVLYGALAGACEDALAGTTGVAWMVSSALVACIAGALGVFPLARRRLLSATIVVILTLVRFIVFLIVERIEGRPLVLITPHLHAMLWQSLFNALLLTVALAVQGRAVAYRVARH